MTSMAEVPAYLLQGVPVLQPPHLEGLSDPSLSTEILPGPPSLLSVQQAAQKRDPKKPPAFMSYLPTSDPGSTYSGLMAGALNISEVDGPRRKRVRVDKGIPNGRAQRASARNLNNGNSHLSVSLSASDPAAPDVPPSRQPSMPPLTDSDPFPVQPESDDPSMSMSRANSLPGCEDFVPPTISERARSTRKDKGKGKEIDRGVRVKEEPAGIISLSPEPSLGLLNEDHCSSCRSLGALVYCDSCPRAFHLWCLDPPMEAVDLSDGEKWFCPSCVIRRNPPPKPAPSFISPLIHLAQTNIPKEFQLPDEIRSFFKDVATGANGTYVDSSELKQPRLNRHGQLEDRDPYRLKDRNGVPVLCFRCGTSALPSGLTGCAPSKKRPRRSTSVTHSLTPESGRAIVSCDYCNLHFHLDCLDPPLTSMPSFGRKWMCPNHADQVLQRKRRIPKQNVAPIDITKSNQWNNGNIEIIHPQSAAMTEKLVLDEVLINGRRYRVPERVIMLDFWSKISKEQHPEPKEIDIMSVMSSPLTSLSSLDEMEEDDQFQSSSSQEPLISLDDLRTAQASYLLLCDLRNLFSLKGKSPTVPPIQPSVLLVNSNNADGQKVTERIMADFGTQTDFELQTSLAVPAPRTIELKEITKPTLAKRKASSRSSARNTVEVALSETASQSQASADLVDLAKPKRARITTKLEKEDPIFIEPVSRGVTELTASQHTEKPERASRVRRKPKQVPAKTKEGGSTGLVQRVPSPPVPLDPPIPPLPEPAPPPTVPPPPVTQSPSKPVTPKASVTITQSGTSSTPTLKIRLPRLSAVSATAHSNLALPALQSPPLTLSPAPDTATSHDSRPRRSLRRRDSASVSVSGASSYTAEVVEDVESTKPKHKPPRGNRKAPLVPRVGDVRSTAAQVISCVSSTMTASTIMPKRVAATRGPHRRSFHVRCVPEPPSAQISELMASYATHPPHPLTLNSLVAFGQPLTPESVLRSVSFVLSEIPRRLARRARALETLPFIVGTNPYVSRTLSTYRQSFQLLASYPPVTTLEENTSFTTELSHLVVNHQNDIPTMAKGFQECAKYMSPTQISNFLDGAIRNRISVRLMAEQHIALSQALQSQRDLWSRCVGAFVSELCEATLGVAPTIIIDGHQDTTFAYVPVHLEYILTEILKNAFRATVERHYKLHGTTSTHTIAPVTVTISPPPSPASPFLSIRIRDQGGGVSPSNMARIFSYAFTTAGNAESDGGPYAAQHVGGSAAVGGGTSAGEGNLFGEITGKGVQVGLGTIAGLGYGLPMSRLYAKYFGGSLDLFSLDGWGSDVYVKLRSVDQAGNAPI
ncbi:hypothetical protein J3R83DRAFT_1825 [Lanmaoa asiatica]|nr:hypothetical protein J3R83DRAFT_1825 [Lanmaoa asiatica]